MTIADTNNMNGMSLIVHFVIEARNRGLFLPYQDLEVIECWINCCQDTNDLLLLLDEHLPSFYRKHEDKPFPPSLSGVKNFILRKIKNLNRCSPVERNSQDSHFGRAEKFL